MKSFTMNFMKRNKLRVLTQALTKALAFQQFALKDPHMISIRVQPTIVMK
jgi:hypothetical protein